MNNPKKKQIVITAQNLFWKFGFKRVSIEEICGEAGVSKMTFYKHFSNKNELVKFIINYITSEAMNKYRNIMSQDIPFPEKVKQSIQLKMESSNEMSEEFFNDFHKNADRDLLAVLNDTVQGNLKQLLNDYMEAQKKGEIRKEINPQFILYFFNKILEMAKDENLLKIYKSPQALIMELTNFFFYGILPRGDEK